MLSHVKSRNFVVCLCGLVAACLFSDVIRSRPPEVRAEARPRVEPPRVGVVDMNMVFRSCTQTRRLSKDLNAAGAKITAWKKEQLASLEPLKARLAKLEAGSQAFNDLTRKISTKALEVRVTAKFRTESLREEQCRNTTKVYKAILDSVREVAKTKGLVMVLRKDPEPQVRKTMVATMGDITNHRLLYASETLDLTNRVLREMNSRASDTPARMPR